MSKPLHNIFSKKVVSSTSSCPNLKVPIIVDTREKQSLVFSELVSLRSNVFREKLDVADFVVGSFAFERKSYNDFCSSLTSGRLFSQVSDLSQFDHPFLILEGFYYNYSDRLHENVFRSSLLSIPSKFKVPVIYTQDESDTAKFLLAAARREEKSGQSHISLRKSKRPKKLVDQQLFVLESFPGIGPASASRLLEVFGSLENIFSASVDTLQKSAVLDEKTLNRFVLVLKSIS